MRITINTPESNSIHAKAFACAVLGDVSNHIRNLPTNTASGAKGMYEAKHLGTINYEVSNMSERDALTTRDMSYDIRHGRSKLDHGKVPTIFVANALDTIDGMVTTLATDLHTGDVKMAADTITLMIQKLCRLQESITR